MYSALNCVLIIVHEDLAVWLYSHFVIHLILTTEWDNFFCPLPSLRQELKPSKSMYCLRVCFGLPNYRWVFSAWRFLQSAVASGTSNPQPGGPVIRTFQLPPPSVPHVWNDASEPQQRKVELWARKLPRILPKVATSTLLLGYFTCRKLTTWDRRLYFPSEGRRAEDFFRAKNPTVWTRELAYQRPACLPLDQRFSNFFQVGTTFISQNVLRTTLLLGLSNSLGLP